ncbi:MAG: peptidase M15 [Magnetococcales bacterium]|nr:peptidase M15 [Magnetococcales bacterium]|tara:strand:- start:307 stop:690 length:384 start_codon:yes stop_codon:yes gene_type:complete
MPKYWKELTHFKPHEFDSPDVPGSAEKGMSEEFMRRLQMLRNLYRKPMLITSGLRTPEYNKKIGGAPASMHVQGKAADILVSGADAYELLGLALTVGFKGVGISQKGPHNSRFIHLDLRDQPTVWSY